MYKTIPTVTYDRLLAQPTPQQYEKTIENLTVSKMELEDIIELQAQLIEQMTMILNTPDINETFAIILLRRHINEYNSKQ